MIYLDTSRACYSFESVHLALNTVFLRGPLKDWYRSENAFESLPRKWHCTSPRLPMLTSYHRLKFNQWIIRTIWRWVEQVDHRLVWSTVVAVDMNNEGQLLMGLIWSPRDSLMSQDYKLSVIPSFSMWVRRIQQSDYTCQTLNDFQSLT